MTAFFSLEEISKSYPGVKANDRITLSMQEGEIHALLGENGSGKSTLVKTIYGLVKADDGTMRLRGDIFEPADPTAAREAGIAMVFQHFSLFDAMTVAENISLGMQDPPPPGQLARLIGETGERYGLPLKPNRAVGGLSAGERQRVEIIRCLLQNPKLLIMDEPTSVLTPQEVEILFNTLRKLAREGTAILYISHKLEEIRALCDSATILRRGQVAATCDPETVTAQQLAEMMVGTTFKSPVRSSTQRSGDLVLEVKGLSMQSLSFHGTELAEISFSVEGGEILGIGGVAGNGQDELVSALSGESEVSQGHVILDGTDLTRASPEERRRQGLLTAPEERLGHAAAPDMSLVENAFLSAAVRQRLSSYGIINWPATRDYADGVIKRFDVRTPGAENLARSLSGGNLQKFVIGREILQKPRALVVNQPTWGVDAAAAAAIRQALIDLAAQGSVVVMVSQDLDELFEISGVIAVLNEGRLSKARPAAELSRNEVGMMMGGSHDLGIGSEAGHAAA